MVSRRDLREDLSEESLRVAILAGLASVPVTFALTWRPVPTEVVTVGGSVSAGPLLATSLLVGVYYRNRTTPTRRAGLWTGLTGSLAMVLVTLLNTATTIGGSPEWMVVASAVALPLVVALSVGIAVLAAMIGALVGAWIATRVWREHHPTDASATDGTSDGTLRWWHLVPFYVVTAPLIVGSGFVVQSEHGAAFVLSWVAMFLFVPLSVLTLVALFIDVTAPRGGDTDWTPAVWTYVGVPIAVYGLAYAITAIQSFGYPAGWGIYAYFGALWVTSVAYVVAKRRNVARGPRER
ncbi:DUF5518 domain-containing protein [Natronorubrum daqingense]|uniref:Uncharacterized protein n=1 Tax=Natronorubrum daqingense TaxID=588898 RepID=A0A1N7D5I7_9EURY|nr:DUF5518 domain-containing protein [Natronorubrum daqingense]APX97229.1 hypothetical protein BB347_11700 [Natronorubrum daqingense]SIR71156.1 hypothetical protein SAMN05421809_2078 [Natronorubrum daqingense]